MTLSEQVAREVRDPFKFGKMFWPHVTFYREQREAIESVIYNDETVIVAGNMLGKDFIAAFIVIYYFLIVAADKTCRIVTTSVKDDHLRVLWGEIGRYLRSSRFPLTKELGGPLVFHHREVKKIINGRQDDVSYIRGMVSEKGEGMAGHHAEFTLGVIDEASGVDDLVYTQIGTWAKRILIFGNPNPCPKTHFFRKAVDGGDIKVG